MDKPKISYEDWKQIFDFTPALSRCQYAQLLEKWAEELLSKTQEDVTPISINQSKVRLVDKTFELLSVVPKRHRTLAGNTASHTCIFQVFQETYWKLKGLELSITPPMLVASVEPVQPFKPQIGGIFLEEIEEVDG